MPVISKRARLFMGVFWFLSILLLGWLVLETLYATPVEKEEIRQARPGEIPPFTFDEFTKFLKQKPKELRLLAKDWQVLSFQTTGDYRLGKNGGVWGIAVGSRLSASTPYLKIEPYNFGGDFAASAENVNIRIFDVTGLEITPQLLSSNYSLKFGGKTGAITVQNPLDLTDNKTFHDMEIYYSKTPRNLSLRSHLHEKDKMLSWPSATIFSPISGTFFSHFRPVTQYTYRRRFDAYNQLDNLLEVTEDYVEIDGRRFPIYEWMQDENNKYSQVYYIVDQVQDKTTGIILISQALQIFIDEKEFPSQEDRTYLILLTTGNDLRVSVMPLDYGLHYSLSVFNPKSQYEGDLVTFNPISKEISVSGAAGKLSVGVNTIATDELSHMTLTISESTYLKSYVTWQNQVTGNDLGQPIVQQFLGLESVVDSVKLNGQELIPRYWESLSPELKGAIIGGLIAFLGSFINLLIDRLKKTAPPVVNVTVPAPIVTIIQEQKPSINPVSDAILGVLKRLIRMSNKGTKKNDG